MTRPGRAWLAALIVVPLLLAAVGCGLGGRAAPQGRHGGASAAAPTGALTITRRGSEVTLDGAVPDPVTRQTLLDLVIASLPDEVTVVDHLVVAPNGTTLDLTVAGPVFEAAAPIPDFRLAVNGDTVTVSGTAATARDRDAVATALVGVWPNANMVDELRLRSAVPPPSS